jgi:hypothetical protein
VAGAGAGLLEVDCEKNVGLDWVTILRPTSFGQPADGLS